MVKELFNKERYNLMKLTKERREELDKIVEKFTSKEKIDMKEDIFKQLDKLNFDVRSADLQWPLCGIILVNETEKKLKGFDKNKVIVYNSEIDYNIYELRFVLAHELAHYIADKDDANNKNIILAARDHSEKYSYDIDEQEKDYMAAALLVPKNDFISEMNLRLRDLKERDKKEISYLDLKNDLYFIQSMQKKYRVDEELVKRRIDEVSDLVG